jgi:hypothetical protein
LKTLRWLFENSSLAFLSYRRLSKFLANIFQNAGEDFLKYWFRLKKIVVKTGFKTASVCGFWERRQKSKVVKTAFLTTYVFLF